MVKYSVQVTENVEKTVSAKGSDIRVSFKNTHQTACAIKGRTLVDAKAYLNAVLEKKRCIPFTRYNSNIGRTAQAKEFKLTQGRWPEKSVKVILSLIQNLEANAAAKSLDAETLVISHISVNQAMRGRRRTYRAHGRISPYLSSPCHINMIATQRAAIVPKASDAEHRDIKLSASANKQRKLRLAF